MKLYVVPLYLMEKIFKSLSHPLDTGIPDYHGFIFIKEVDTKNGVLYLGGGGAMSYTTFGTWGRGDKGDKILNCYTFDLFTLSINIH